MYIDHIAIWTNDLEALKNFYMKYFNAVAGEKYTNSLKKFESYFLKFDNQCRLELMQMSGVSDRTTVVPCTGLAHFAIAVGSRERVDALTALLKEDGITVADGPRQTGDGYYESVVLDPEGNSVEITI